MYSVKKHFVLILYPFHNFFCGSAIWILLKVKVEGVAALIDMFLLIDILGLTSTYTSHST